MEFLSPRQLADGPDAYLALDKEAHVLLHNPGAELLFQRLFQVRIPAEHRQPLRGVLPGAEAQPFVSTCERALAKRQPAVCELYLERTETWLEFRAYPAAHGLSVFLRDITLPKQAEAATRRLDREQLEPVAGLPGWASGSFQTVAENLLECLGVYSAIRDEGGEIVDFRVEYVNDPACHNNHLSREVQVGMQLGELLPGHHGGGLIAEYARVVESGEPLYKEELVYEDVYGEQQLKRAFAIRIAKLGDGFVAAWQDITERNQFQEALQHSELRLKNILEQLPSALVIAEAPTGRITAMNAEAERILGPSRLPVTQFEDYRQFEILYADGTPYPVAQHPALRALHGESIRGERLSYRTRDGALRELYVNAAPLRDADGQITACVCVFDDVTEQHQAEQALAASEQRFQILAASAPVGIFLTDATGACLWVNAQWCVQTGLPAEAAQGFGWCDALHPMDRAGVNAEWQAAIREEREFNAEYRYRTPAGRLTWVHGRSVPLRDAAGAITGYVGTISDITALRESEERRSAALAASETGTFRWDLGTNALDWDENLDRLFGLEPGHTARSLDAFIALVHPDDRSGVIERCVRCAASGADFEMEFRTVRPDGTIRWLYDKGKTFLDGAGRPEYMTGACVDVTERKLAEQSLRESEERLRTIGEAIPQIVWVTRPDGWHEHYNQRWYDYTGLTPEETCGWGWSRPLHPDDHARSEARWKVATDTGEPYEIEYRLRGADGNYRWFLGRALPLRNSAGEITRWFGTCTDIHDQKLAQEERSLILAREQQRSRQLRLLAQAALEVNAAPTLEEMLRTVTQRACATIGARLGVTSTIPEEDVGQAAHTVQATAEYAAWKDPALRMNSAGASLDAYRKNRVMRLSEEELRERPGGNGFALETGAALPTGGWLAAPLLARDGRRLGVLQLSGKDEGEFTDDDALLLLQLAQMAAVAIEKAQLHEEIRRSDQAKTDFLAMLAHELRNPLSPILTAALVIRTRPDSEAALRALSVIERQATHLSRLVEDLLDVSRITRGRIELRMAPVRLAGIVDQAVEAVRPLLETRKHRLVVTTQPDTWLQADSARMVQVLTNLLNNAAKYTDPGGEIHVRTRREEARAVIEIRDTGIGIAAGDLPYIFDLFAQVDRDVSRSQGGLGIGLTMVRNLVQLHDGTVTAASPGRGKGSLFTLSLPRIADPATAAEPPVTSTAVARPGGRRVVVVDDNRDAADSLADLLQLWGHEPQIAHDGHSGIDLILRERPDVAFLDIGLPGLDGYELARRLRREASLEGILLIALTGYGQDADRHRALEAGFDHHHTKPVNPETLRKLLNPSP